jgi:uncharacterized protein
MRYKTKDIGDDGLDVSLAVTQAWLAAECPDVDVRAASGGVSLAGRLEKSGDSYLLRGELKGALLTPCGRCLEPAEVPLDVAIAVSYVEVEGKDDPDDPFAGDDDPGQVDVLSFRDGVIDLSAELRDEILLAIPIGPLCRPDCAGICSVCGGNRNLTPCDCEERQKMAASKFGALKNVKV